MTKNTTVRVRASVFPRVVAEWSDTLGTNTINRAVSIEVNDRGDKAVITTETGDTLTLVAKS
jgi:hypothetical protein